MNYDDWLVNSWAKHLKRLAHGLAALCCVTHLASCSDGKDATSEPWFVDETQIRGLDFTYVSGFTDRALLPQIVGGGAALVDVDGDGDLDAYLVQGGARLQLRDQQELTAQAPGNQLYLNDGKGHFTLANAGDAADDGYGMGVATGDYDHDGDVDLYVTNVGRNALLRNDGKGNFEDVASAAGVDDAGWGSAAAFADLDTDGDLDLFVVNYINWSLAVERECSNKGRPTYCAPTAYDSPAMDRLYRNNGDGTFTEITADAGLNLSLGNGLGTVVEDFDGDGMADIFVANDRLLDQLWINQGDLRFVNEATARGVAMDDNGIAKAGMGVATADVDHDGDEDLLVVNFTGETDSFYRNEGQYFVDVTARAGLAVASRKHTRFGVVLADFDNDGEYDLFEANGKVDGDPVVQPDTFAEPNKLFRGLVQSEGFISFEERSIVAQPKPRTSRAVARGDVDNDGRLDLLIVNRDAPAQLLLNRTATSNAWVSFLVLDEVGGVALGAKVTVRTGARTFHKTVRTSSSFLAAHDARTHFGLGEAKLVQEEGKEDIQTVSVVWPDGRSETFAELATGKVHVLRPGLPPQADR